MPTSVMYRSQKNKSQVVARKYHSTEKSPLRYLAYRDIHGFFEKYGITGNALDYGCGTGISSSFLQSQGLNVVGVDISNSMLDQARSNYPDIPFETMNDSFRKYNKTSFDILFSGFVLFEIPSKTAIMDYIIQGRELLKPSGFFIFLVGTEQMYTGDWLIFQTNYPENRNLKSGHLGRVLLTDVNIEFVDYHWTTDDHIECITNSGLKICEIHQPLGKAQEPFQWKDELYKPLFSIFIAQLI